MPWLSEAKKDVTSCDKQRGGANIRYIRWFPNGATHYNEDVVPVVIRGANPENWNILVPGGKENKSDSLSSGDRTGKSPNRFRFGGDGVEGPRYLLSIRNGRYLESYIGEGEKRTRHLVPRWRPCHNQGTWLELNIPLWLNSFIKSRLMNSATSYAEQLGVHDVLAWESVHDVVALTITV